MSTNRELLADAVKEMQPVGKNRKADSKMGGYSFQTIDDIQAMVDRVLGPRGLWIRSETLSYSNIRDEADARRYDGLVMVRYDISGPYDDDVPLGTFAGTALDWGDKALNKAYTAAKKRMFLDVFHIPTYGMETDSEAAVHEDPPRRAPAKKAAKKAPAKKAAPKAAEKSPEPDQEPSSMSFDEVKAAFPSKAPGPWKTKADAIRAGVENDEVERRGSQWFRKDDPVDPTEATEAREVKARQYRTIEREAEVMAASGEEPF